ncbi:hypothetical protein DU506_00415 [Vreelandella rituensis]|uniref:Uncharacterized protein n=1 Tax=Vreelandella rituensis TaxID=2282306 RepID=A0A368U9X2_9GAMM|nr:hypothetical protein DU506_00415 [Halomonas rituensis]
MTGGPDTTPTHAPNAGALARLDALWRELGDVPTREDQEGALVLDAGFQLFDPGTPVEDIWHWFEAQHAGFKVAEKLGCAE